MAEYGVDFAAEAAVWLSGIGLSSSVVSGSREVTWNPIHLVTPAPNDPGPLRAYNVLRRVRAHLATTSDERYRATVERLGTLRCVPGGGHASGHVGELWVRVATSYLLPTEQEWLDADIGFTPIVRSWCSPPEQHQRSYDIDFGVSSVPADSLDSLALLSASATTAEQLTRIAEMVEPARLFRHVYNIAAQVGPASADVVAAMLDARLHAPFGWGARKRSTGELAELLARFPTDGAMELLRARAANGLVFGALSRAAGRFPCRARRLLSVDLTQAAPAHLVRALERLRPETTGDAAQDQLCGTSGHLRNAEPHELPDVLVSPPWKRSPPPSQHLSLEERPDRPLRLNWRAGEQALWAAMPVTRGWWYERGMLEVVSSAQNREDYRRSVLNVDHEPFVLALISEYIARPILRDFQVPETVHSPCIFQRILGRFGADALDAVVATMARHPLRMASVMAPVDGSRVAVLMMRCLGVPRTNRAAVTWWLRHTNTAVQDLIPIALGRQGRDRMLAQQALRTVAQTGHRGAVDVAATGYGEQARTAISAMLDADPTLSLPHRIPRLPAWLVPGLLPPVALRDGRAVLPESAVENFCTMLAMCRPGWQYAGVRIVADIADPTTLAEFAWGLYEAWMLADCPNRDQWVLHAQGLVGNEHTARQLCEQILEGQWRIGESSRAALDAITAIGGDEAVAQLRAIVSASSANGMVRKARHRIRELTEPDSAL
ncbi:hypothetical protein ACIBG0_07075 [Nocardia sp. NPDC050630]|uniref:hypothetical protein n=1 Tax=Nocardia sp. NPDC050630 TaxID=3364321 RepID=UPI0037AF1A3D